MFYSGRTARGVSDCTDEKMAEGKLIELYLFAEHPTVETTISR